jgi:hypothetical protein
MLTQTIFMLTQIILILRRRLSYWYGRVFWDTTAISSEITVISFEKCYSYWKIDIVKNAILIDNDYILTERTCNRFSAKSTHEQNHFPIRENNSRHITAFIMLCICFCGYLLWKHYCSLLQSKYYLFQSIRKRHTIIYCSKDRRKWIFLVFFCNLVRSNSLQIKNN